MLQAGRSKHTDEYRFGFQGQEADNKIGGLGQHTTAQFWEYDTRAVKRWNTDPKPNPAWSEYAVFGGNPILFSDVLGDTILINLHNKKADKNGYNTARNIIKKQKNDGVFLVASHGAPLGILNANIDPTTGAITNDIISDAGDLQSLIYQADREQNFKKNGKYKYGGLSYEQQVTNGDKVQVILYACYTACYKDNRERGINRTGEDTYKYPIARRFSAFLSTFNVQNTVTAANGYLVGGNRGFLIYERGFDRLDNQNGLWITYENGIPKFKRNFVFTLRPGEKYVTQYTDNKLSKPQEIKEEEKSKY